jgi:hypothetical protein
LGLAGHRTLSVYILVKWFSDQGQLRQVSLSSLAVLED